ncbi:vascular endothelial growth factor A isoform X2 [Drosophila busckii]|uniref:vascular endothelial growth factor A isoform X2 n=1 Tax=Drosophila busckii TaxID=30019 RepID=UPI00083F138E|nr:vascular endothelial growth factor A isoform X2 [Drosophila busckii]
MSARLAMTQTQRSRATLQTLSLLLLLLLCFINSICLAAQSQPSPRFFYAAAEAQSKVRAQRQTASSGSASSNAAEVEASSCCQGAAAAAAEPVTVSVQLSNVTADYGEADGSGEYSSRETYKRSVDRAIKFASPARCSPQPTIVELKPSSEGDHTSGNVYFSPACTRVNRCNGCCGSTLISCQPTQTELVKMRVRQMKDGVRDGFAIVDVEQHLDCKCDCRIKAEDCNAYQEYRKDLCRCECQNTDARQKCLEQSEHKYWDDANCTCVCRYNQSCTTGTVFDETLCKCTDPAAPLAIADRRRFIVQAVAVEPDNSTLYSV